MVRRRPVPHAAHGRVGFLMGLALAVGVVLSGASLSANAGDDEAKIAALIGSTWDKPDARVETGPVTVVGGHAIAGWTQGARGGRALLRKSAGTWSVVLCGGDALRDAAALAEAGVPREAAETLAAHLAEAERKFDPKRREQFSTFEGVMRLEPSGSDRTHPQN